MCVCVRVCVRVAICVGGKWKKRYAMETELLLCFHVAWSIEHVLLTDLLPFGTNVTAIDGLICPSLYVCE